MIERSFLDTMEGQPNLNSTVAKKKTFLFVCLFCVFGIFICYLGSEMQILPRNVKSNIEDQLSAGSKSNVNLVRRFLGIFEEYTDKENEEAIYESYDARIANGSIPLCPLIPKKLVGRLKMPEEAKNWTDISKELHQVSLGGRYTPQDCISRHKVAIVIPFRDREEHLKIFLYHMHPILMRQNLDYGIFIINQKDNMPFNRAMLFNVGFTEASKDYKWQCFIFHDIDLLPENDRNLYTCPDSPRHMSVAPKHHGYKLMYKKLFGGIVAFSVKDFKLVNGFSNQFWGWGGEDDDMWNRVANKNLEVQRYSKDIARYTNLNHTKQEANKERHKILAKGKKRFQNDGLTNLKYDVLKKIYNPLFTEIQVQLEKVDPKKKKSVL